MLLRVQFQPFRLQYALILEYVLFEYDPVIDISAAATPERIHHLVIRVLPFPQNLFLKTPALASVHGFLKHLLGH